MVTGAQSIVPRTNRLTVTISQGTGPNDAHVSFAWMGDIYNGRDQLLNTRWNLGIILTEREINRNIINLLERLDTDRFGSYSLSGNYSNGRPVAHATYNIEVYVVNTAGNYTQTIIKHTNFIGSPNMRFAYSVADGDISTLPMFRILAPRTAFSIKAHREVYRVPVHERVYRVPVHERVYRVTVPREMYRVLVPQEMYRVPVHQKVYRIGVQDPIFKIPVAQTAFRAAAQREVFSINAQRRVFEWTVPRRERRTAFRILIPRTPGKTVFRIAPGEATPPSTVYRIAPNEATPPGAIYRIEPAIHDALAQEVFRIAPAQHDAQRRRVFRIAPLEQGIVELYRIHTPTPIYRITPTHRRETVFSINAQRHLFRLLVDTDIYVPPPLQIFDPTITVFDTPTHGVWDDRYGEETDLILQNPIVPPEPPEPTADDIQQQLWWATMAARQAALNAEVAAYRQEMDEYKEETKGDRAILSVLKFAAEGAISVAETWETVTFPMRWVVREGAVAPVASIASGPVAAAGWLAGELNAPVAQAALHAAAQTMQTTEFQDAVAGLVTGKVISSIAKRASLRAVQKIATAGTAADAAKDTGLTDRVIDAIIQEGMDAIIGDWPTPPSMTEPSDDWIDIPKADVDSALEACKNACNEIASGSAFGQELLAGRRKKWQ